MTTHLKTLRFARALLYTNLKGAFALRAAFWLRMSLMALNNVVFFVFWLVLFDRVPHLRGWGLADMQVLFGVTAASFGLSVALAGGAPMLGHFIDEGELDPLLTQPKPTLLYALGLRSQASGYGDFFSGVGFMLWSGHVSWRNAAAAALAIASGTLIFVACGVMFFSLAFWLRKSKSLSRQLYELLITFSLYPEPLFGGGLRLILFTLLPAGFIAYVPARLIRHPSWTDALILIASALVYLTAACFVFARGLRRYASGSRFSVLG